MTQFDPKLLERGIISSPGALATVEAFIASVHKIDFFKGNVTTMNIKKIVFNSPVLL